MVHTRKLTFNREDYILRKEFFGGLVIAGKGSRKFEISKFDYTFLMEFFDKKTLTQDAASKISEQNKIIFKPDVQFYLEKNILTNKQQVTNLVLGKKNDDLKNRLSFPLEITICPTLKCQLNCSFYFLGSRLNENIQEYSAADWKAVVESSIKNGVYSVSILGGEPSSYYDIENLLIYLSSLRVNVTMTSNGQSWSKDLVNIIANSKNITPVFSIQSLNNQDNYMGKNFVLENSLSLMHELFKRGKNFRVNSVNLGQDVKTFTTIVDYLAKLNVKRYSIANNIKKINAKGNLLDTLKLSNVLNEYKQSREYEISISTEGCMLFTSVDDFDGSIVRTNFQKLTYGCSAGNTILEVLPDGSVYPCASFFTSEPCGNVFEEDIKSIWVNSVPLNHIATTVNNDRTCKKCTSFHFCNGGCPAYNYRITGAMFDEGDQRCLIKKQLLTS